WSRTSARASPKNAKAVRAPNAASRVRMTPSSSTYPAPIERGRQLASRRYDREIERQRLDQTDQGGVGSSVALHDNVASFDARFERHAEEERHQQIRLLHADGETGALVAHALLVDQHAVPHTHEMLLVAVDELDIDRKRPRRGFFGIDAHG